MQYAFVRAAANFNQIGVDFFRWQCVLERRPQNGGGFSRAPLGRNKPPLNVAARSGQGLRQTARFFAAFRRQRGIEAALDAAGPIVLRFGVAYQNKFE